MADFDPFIPFNLDGETSEPQYETKEVVLAGTALKIRQFDFHPLNANYVWPGNEGVCQYILNNVERFRGKRIIELGSATGILSIFLKKHGLDVTASDYDDPEIEENVRFNATANEVELPYIPHTWGTPFPADRTFDVVVASDILLYVKSYPALVETLEKLLPPSRREVFFLMGWRRRIDDEKVFFGLLGEKGFSHADTGHRIFEIRRRA
eukprot:tig00020563_g11209.t1